VVTKDVSDYALVFGNPAKLKGWICECGEKLKLTKNRTSCQRCSKKYKKIGNIVSVFNNSK